jgi:hypothetical protein
MVAAATDLVPSAEEEARLTLPPRRPRRERRLAVAVGGLAVVGATTSVAVAAQSSLPGETLYPIKRAIENAQTGFSPSQADKGSHLLTNASGRLDEAARLSEQGSLEDHAQVPSTLNTFTEQATQASDLLLTDYARTGRESSVAELRSFTADSMATLAALEDVVPDEARDELFHAARVLEQIDAEAAQACPACPGGITQVPAILTSGTSGFTGTPSADRPRPDKSARGDAEQDGPGLPDTGADLPPGSVLDPPQSDTSTPSGSGGTGSADGGTTNPLKDLTDGLINGGSEPTSRGGNKGGDKDAGGGLPQLPDLGETVDGLTDPLLGGGN